MKRVMFLIAAAALVGFAAAPTMAYYAGTAWFSDSYGSTNGGEFICHPSGNWSAHRLEATAPNFETFCVERNEYLNFGQQYIFKVDIDSAAIKGGLGGGNPDPLDARTAWLYCEFVKGTLQGYDYANTGVGRVDSADALQYAIWYIENEATANELNNLADPVKRLAWSFYNLSEGKSASCTYVMNLWRLDNPWGWGSWNDQLKRYEYQSLLVCVPAPAAAMLGVIGLGLVGWVKRRLA